MEMRMRKDTTTSLTSKWICVWLPGGDEDEEALLSQNYSDLIYAEGSEEEDEELVLKLGFISARDEEGD